MSRDARDEGFSLVEALVSLLVVSFIFLAIAQLIGTGVYVNRASEDLTEATAYGSEKMEELRQLDYSALTPGGDVDSDVEGYYDDLDLDGDGQTDYTRRWEIIDQGDSKRIRIRVFSTVATMGPAKETNLVSLVAEP